VNRVVRITGDYDATQGENVSVGPRPASTMRITFEEEYG
jgi:hypothetical protein